MTLKIGVLYSSVMTKAKANKPSKKPKTLPPTVRAEAELESRIAAALMQAFPNLGRDQLVEQRRFTVRLGPETPPFASTPEGRRLRKKGIRTCRRWCAASNQKTKQ